MNYSESAVHAEYQAYFGRDADAAELRDARSQFDRFGPGVWLDELRYDLGQRSRPTVGSGVEANQYGTAIGGDLDVNANTINDMLEMSLYGSILPDYRELAAVPVSAPTVVRATSSAALDGGRSLIPATATAQTPGAAYTAPNAAANPLRVLQTGGTQHDTGLVASQASLAPLSAVNSRMLALAAVAVVLYLVMRR